MKDTVYKKIPSSIKIRKPNIKDAYRIQKLMKKYSYEGELLIRPMSDIFRQIRDFTVLDLKGKPIGLIALHVYWEDLGELRSFVVEKKYREYGWGERLINSAIKEAKEIGVKKIFALTKIPDFFLKFGFKHISRKKLPHKVWSDCFNCTKYPKYCDEKAVIFKIKDII